MNRPTPSNATTTNLSFGAKRPMIRATTGNFSFRAKRGICFSPAFLLLYALAALLPLPARAQVTTGTPPFGSFSGGPDIINLANLNAHIDIPFMKKTGRGLNFTYDMTYDSSLWYPVGAIGSQSWQPVYNWGWLGQTQVTTGYLTYYYGFGGRCSGSHGAIYYDRGQYSHFVYFDSNGVPHGFPGAISFISPPCTPAYGGSLNVTAADGSGYQLQISVDEDGGITSYTVISRTGTQLKPPLQEGAGTATSTDRNGNQISVSSSGLFTDTLGTTALTVAGSGTPSSPTTFTYTAPSGSPSYAMKYTGYTVQTKFACSGIADYGPTSNNLVSEIDLPDISSNPNDKYTFTYEQTPGVQGNVTGRLYQVTLPTGGTITYTYAGGNGGINCSDGSTATLTRTINPGGTWSYAQTKGSGAASTTIVTDPQNNQTTIQFQGIYETQRVSSLLTTNTCYNGATSPCIGTAVALPINARSVTTILSGNLQSQHSETYSAYGVPTEIDDYDYGASTPFRKVLITYASLNTINAFRQTVTVQDGSGHTVSQTNYNYDQGTLQPSSGTPQHVSVSGSRGNLTSINYPTGLTASFGYYDTGMLYNSTDVNGAVTGYSYSVCGNAFPTQINYPAPNNVPINTSYTWDCTGGVQLKSTDFNGQPTTTAYADPYFWRPFTFSYADGGQTKWTYNSPTSITTTTKMNASQNIVSTTLLDGLGRTSQTQLNSDPEGVDYTDTTYDPLGRVASVSNPYRSTSDPTYGVTSTKYDALNRPTSVTLPDNSVSNAIYSGNTVTLTDPAGKKRQLTLDALGRTTQVTEDPGGLGYVTTYTYDALSNLTNVAQNGSRPRTYVYDGLSRLTSEANPESGTATYNYNGNGDLASRTDARGITTTYSYDSLHRITNKSHSDGSNGTNFYYDMSNPFNHPVSNPAGRLVGILT